MGHRGRTVSRADWTALTVRALLAWLALSALGVLFANVLGESLLPLLELVIRLVTQDYAPALKLLPEQHDFQIELSGLVMRRLHLTDSLAVPPRYRTDGANPFAAYAGLGGYRTDGRTRLAGFRMDGTACRDITRPDHGHCSHRRVRTVRVDGHHRDLPSGMGREFRGPATRTVAADLDALLRDGRAVASGCPCRRNIYPYGTSVYSTPGKQISVNNKRKLLDPKTSTAPHNCLVSPDSFFYQIIWHRGKSNFNFRCQ